MNDRFVTPDEHASPSREPHKKIVIFSTGPEVGSKGLRRHF